MKRNFTAQLQKPQKLCSLKGGVHGSAHVHESKYFFAFARYDPSLFNLIRCLRTIRKGIGNSGGNFSYDYFACKYS